MHVNEQRKKDAIEQKRAEQDIKVYQTMEDKNRVLVIRKE
jgi:hypothetical protein